MNKILLILVFVVSTHASVAQSTVAKLKFEEAEEAYANNNPEVALAKLKETETILKATNPRILYLQILAQNKIISKDTLKDYTIIEATRKAINKYLKDYDNLPDNEDKYRDIYKISESFKAMPASRQVFDELVSKKAKAKQDIVDAAAYKLKRSQDGLIKFAARYGFDPNKTITEFSTLDPKNSLIAETKRAIIVRDGKEYNYRIAKKLSKDGTGPFIITTDEHERLVTMHYVLGKGKRNISEQMANVMAELKQNIDAEYIAPTSAGTEPTAYFSVPGVSFRVKLAADDSYVSLFFELLNY